MSSKLDRDVNAICEGWQKACGNSRPFPTRDKTIQDPVHGAIEVERELVYILDSVMMQRLRRISQLGMTNQVFPGANHTRFEHSLGVMHLVGRILERLREEIKLTDDQVTETKAAGLLHDIGHLPFSHTPEPLLDNDSSLRKEEVRLKIKPSELLTMKIIKSPWMKRIFEEINTKTRRRLNHNNVANLAVGYPPANAPRLNFLGELSHADFDADRMDYLMRDAHFTGVPLGTLDSDRLIRTATVSTSLGHTKHLAIHVKGLHSLESMIVARSMMYSTVYFHHAVRAANGMLLRAIHSSFRTNPLKLLEHDDASLIYILRNSRGESSKWMNMLIARTLFKPALMFKTSYALNESGLMDFLSDLTLETMIDHEKRICRRVDKGRGMCCMLDLPKVERYSEVEANIVENEKVSLVKEHSRIAEAIGKDPDLKWRGYVFSPDEKTKEIGSKALEYFAKMNLTFSEQVSPTVMA